MCLCNGEVGLQIVKCRQDCYDVSNLESAEEQLSLTYPNLKIDLASVMKFPICI